VISFFQRSDLIDLFPDGIVGTELNDDFPRDIVGPLSPLPEEETNNQRKLNSQPNNITGGD
jgi:hypothetical protein